MRPDMQPGPGKSQEGTGPPPEKDPANDHAGSGGPGSGGEDAEPSQNGEKEAPTEGALPSERPAWDELQWSLFGLGPDGEPDGKALPTEERTPHGKTLNGDAAEGVASRADKLDTETRRALQEIDSYASASALAQERAALMGRADDLRMDLRDMQEQIREMEGAARGLQVAFKEAYRRPEEALRVWSRLVYEIRLVGETRSAGSSGLGTASQILAASPERLGALRGASAFGFSTPARSEALRAAARIAGHARVHQDAARRAARLGVFGRGQSEETVLSHGVLKKGLSAETGTGRYPGLDRKEEEIEAMRKEADALAEKVRELTGGRPLSKQGQAVTEKVRSLAPEQRQALREVILGAGAPSVDKARREAGKSAPSGRGAAARGSGPGRTPVLNAPALKRSATARSTVRRGQPAKTTPSTAGTMEAGAMKGLLKASLRHVAIHVAIRTLDRVEKEARGREMLEI